MHTEKKNRNLSRLKRVFTHLVLYPMRLVVPILGKRKYTIYKWILKFQNSVPLYLVLFPGDTAVQVGTPNVLTVKRFSRLVGKNGTVVIVEADPDNANTIEKSLSKTRYQNVKIINKGAWSIKTKLTFHKSSEFNGDHKIPIDGVVVDQDISTDYSEEIEINVDTLDNLLEEQGITTFDYLSVTVNGAEYEVLKGTQQLIEHSSNNVKIYAKGHARVSDEEGEYPIHMKIDKYLSQKGFSTVISKGENSVSGLDTCRKRTGDIFAWKC